MSMTLEEVAVKVIDAAEGAETEFMVVGALAAGAYGIPRSTRDFDLLVGIDKKGAINSIVKELKGFVEFDPQVVFDTITWGSRHVGRSKTTPSYKVELFETFEDPFVTSEFARKERLLIPALGRETWLPTAEDVVVQKLRWARPKDLEDVRDVIAVQGTDSLDMEYIKSWCKSHQSIDRLVEILENLPDID